MSEDRRARLAALRKNRSNKDVTQIPSATVNMPTDTSGKNEVHQKDLLSTKTELQKSEVDKEEKSSEIDPHDSEAQLNQEKEMNDDIDIELNNQEVNTNKASYTEDMKKDLKHYFHKAEIRNNRAIDKIIQERLLQD